MGVLKHATARIPFALNKVFIFFRIGQLVELKMTKWVRRDVPAPDTVYNNIILSHNL